MATTTLSIIIPTLEVRAERREKLMDVLVPQCSSDVEILMDDREPPVKIGTKLNDMLSVATGKYYACMGDDDMVAEYYIEEILSAAEEDPDFIGWKQNRSVNGRMESQETLIRPDFKYSDRGADRKRPLSTSCPVRTSIGITEPFRDTNWGEDRNWCERVHPKIKSWVYIDKIMYTYQYGQWSLARHD